MPDPEFSGTLTELVDRVYPRVGGAGAAGVVSDVISGSQEPEKVIEPPQSLQPERDIFITKISKRYFVKFHMLTFHILLDDFISTPTTTFTFF